MVRVCFQLLFAEAPPYGKARLPRLNRSSKRLAILGCEILYPSRSQLLENPRIEKVIRCSVRLARSGA